MIRSVLIALVGALLLPATPFCQAAYAAGQNQGGAVDGIAAVVNNDVITYSQVRELVGPREKLLRSQLSGPELEAKIKEVRLAAVRDLIDRQLIIQAFEKEQFQIPEHFIDQRINEVIRESFGGDRNTFIKTLQAQNFTLAQFRKMERDKMVVQAMRGKNVKVNTAVPPSKIDEYYAKHREEFTSKEEIKLRMIMIPGHESEPDAASQKAMAEEIRAKVAAGAEFDKMAQMYSEDATRDMGGDWGWIERKTLAEPLEKVAFSLPAGKVSNIIALGGNYYIMKVEDRRGGASRPIAEVRAEIEKKLTQEEAQRLQERWLASLRQKAYIKTF
jgi:parvulin-like peptidyl-prolyl isomerase